MVEVRVEYENAREKGVVVTEKVVPIPGPPSTFHRGWQKRSKTENTTGLSLC